MSEKETAGKISRLYGFGRSLRSRGERLASGKSRPSRRFTRAGKIALLFALSLAIALILAPKPQKPLQNYRVGDISREDVKGVKDFLVEDVETTAKRQKEVLAEVPQAFDLDELAAAQAKTKSAGPGPLTGTPKPRPGIQQPAGRGPAAFRLQPPAKTGVSP